MFLKGCKAQESKDKACEKCNAGYTLGNQHQTAVRITSSQRVSENTKWGYTKGDRDKPWTVRLWVKRDSSLERSGDNMCALFSGDSPGCSNDVPPQTLDKYKDGCGAYGFGIYDHNGKWDVYYGTHYKKLSGKPLGLPWFRVETGKEVLDDVWHQWTVAFKGRSGTDDLYFYLDGALVYSTEGVARKSWAPNTFNQRPVYIGREGYVSATLFCWSLLSCFCWCVCACQWNWNTRNGRKYWRGYVDKYEFVAEYLDASKVKENYEQSSACAGG